MVPQIRLELIPRNYRRDHGDIRRVEMAICRWIEDRRAIEITQVPDLLLIIEMPPPTALQFQLRCFASRPDHDLVPM